MKPSFALDLRSSVVTLLHRTASGWTKVGEVSLEAPDLVEALAFMRTTALGLSPRGITTKVILPNTQILYTSLKTSGAGPTTRTRLIAAALEGMTPYAFEDLAFDWCEGEAGLQIAVLAKKTLEEAEAFALNHRFNPVSFVAVPEDEVFAGEAFFGPSRLSKALLTKGETVERDTEAVRVADRAGSTPPVGAESPAASAISAEPLPPAQAISASPLAAPPPLGETSAPRPAEEPAVTGGVTALTPLALEQDLAEPPAAISPDTPPVHAAVAPNADLAERDAPLGSVPEAPIALDVDSDGAPQADHQAPSPLAQALSGVVPTPTKSAPSPDDRLRATGPAPSQRAPVPRPAVAKPVPAPLRKPVAARPWQAGNATRDKTRATLDRVAGAAAQSAAQQRRTIILILTAVLVTLLAIVAIWSAISLSTNEAKKRSPTTIAQSGTESVEPRPSTAASLDSPAPSSSAPSQLAAPPTPIPLDEATADGQASETPSTDPPQTAPLDPAPKTDVVADVAAARPETAGQDEIFLASADTPPVSLDSFALPALQGAADTAPVQPLDPPPYVAPEVETPPSGLTATPKGATPPAGVFNWVGRLPIWPTLQAQSLILTPPLSPVGALPGAPIVQDLAAQDPTLADKPPRPRPADLVPVAAVPAASDSGASDSLAPDRSYAKLPPQPRPADLKQAPKAQDAEAPSLVLTSSPRPQPRPADIGTGTDAGIDGAVAVALNQDAPTDQAEAPSPSLPTNASVAKQATDLNVLKANGIVLLAVFGTPTSRYAMIRLGNGRIKKVQLGDTFDGGRIAGITADTVQYQKGSRVVTLSLPQG